MTTWTGRCSSRGMAVLGLGLALVLLAIGLGTELALRGSSEATWVGWFVAIVGVLSGVTVWWVSSLRVTVDESRFVVAFGPLGWPRRVVDVADIADVSAIVVEPMEWGGWGYRWIPWARATAAVLRKGPGIVLTLTDGRRFAVTVQDAVAGAQATAAAMTARRGQ